MDGETHAPDLVPLTNLTPWRFPNTAAPAPSEPTHGEPQPGPLNARERRILGALVEAALPGIVGTAGGGVTLPAGDASTERAMMTYLGHLQRHGQLGYRALLWALDTAALASTRRRLADLNVERRRELLASWTQSKSFPLRVAARTALTPIKLEHFARNDVAAALGVPGELPPVREEPARWQSQVLGADDLDETLECDVVVVGSGAGGGVVAYELARRGHAVVVLEEGPLATRNDFRKPSEAFRKFYRDQGLTVALGNAPIPVWAGRMVGGSTAINSGTCLRPPARTLGYWQSRYRLGQELSERGLAPYFDRVESMLNVAPAPREHAGRIADVIARGADALGYRHHVLPRNAPGCDGQGVCCHGCPTGAKRSTDVSYIPAALERGAVLIPNARVNEVEVVAGRARGVVAFVKRADGSIKRLHVRGQAVVIATGTLITPVLLADTLRHPYLGKNLSIHPACKVLADMHERMDQWRGIPQSYTIDEFDRDGLLFEGGSLRPELLSVGIPWAGPKLMELMSRYHELATFAFMIQDHSRGSVRRGRHGRPVIRYRLVERDRRLLQRGLAILSEVFFAAGARRVFPFVPGFEELSHVGQVDGLRHARLAARDLELTAYHPLGTCRIGTDPERSVLGPDHQTHEVEALYVVDGSAVPSSLGANPMVTIMALATRASDIIDTRLK